MHKKIGRSAIFLSFIFVTLFLTVYSSEYFSVKVEQDGIRQKELYYLSEGDLIILNDEPRIPCIFHGGSTISWSLDKEGNLIINGRLRGLVLKESNIDILRENPAIEILFLLDGKSLPDKMFSNLSEHLLRNVYLSLEGYSGPSNDLKYLEKITNRLRFLSLRKASGEIPDDLDLTYLLHLDLSDSGITDRSLNNIINFKMLTSLNLSGTRISGKGLKNLENLNNISILDLSNTAITDDDLDVLRYLPVLQKLNISHTSIGDDGLKKLTNNKQLINLNASYTGITDKGLNYLDDLTMIKELDISGITIKDNGKGLRALEALPSLHILHLRDTELDDKLLSYITENKQYRLLDLSNTGLNDRALRHLSDLLYLEELYLAHNKIYGDGIKYLADLGSTYKLILLDLTGNKITGPQQQYFKKLVNLEVLYLGATDFTDWGVSFLRDLNKLSVLDLSNTKAMKESLEFLVDIPRLSLLYLSGSGYSEEDVERLRSRLPLCKIIFEE